MRKNTAHQVRRGVPCTCPVSTPLHLLTAVRQFRRPVAFDVVPCWLMEACECNSSPYRLTHTASLHRCSHCLLNSSLPRAPLYITRDDRRPEFRLHAKYYKIIAERDLTIQFQRKSARFQASGVQVLQAMFTSNICSAWNQLKPISTHLLHTYWRFINVDSFGSTTVPQVK